MCFFSPTTDALTPLRSHATPDRSATVHPTCSMHTLGNDTSLRRIAAQLADKPFYPLTSTLLCLRRRSRLAP